MAPQQLPAKYPPVPADLTLAQVRAAIPKEMFRQDTLRSLSYLLRDLLQVGAAFAAMHYLFAPALAAMEGVRGEGDAVVRLARAVAWNVYWFVQGLNFTALWILAHEAGHGAFSASKTVNEVVGFVVHSALLVPYHAWRASHATHHMFTNHLDRDTAFVPTKQPGPLQEAVMESPLWSFVMFWFTLLVGWPAYFTFNVWGQPNRHLFDKNHFLPSSSLFRPHDAVGVVLSDLGLVAVVGACVAAALRVGWWPVAAYYYIPYLWCNAWLVFITFMHHGDTRVAHFDETNFTYVRGACSTIDRDYGFVNAWLHYINDSHVVHHLFHEMPFYNAIEVTRRGFVKRLIGPSYACDTRSIFAQAVDSWRGCSYVVPSEGVAYFRAGAPAA